MKNNKVSILYVDPFFDLGGQEIYLLNIIKGLNRDNFVIHIACPKKNALIHELRNIKNITFLHISMTRKFDLISIIKLWYYIINNHIDIVHMNGSRAGLIGRIASIFTNSKIVFTPHLLFLDYKQSYNAVRRKFYIWIDRLLNLFTDYIITVCDEQSERLKNKNQITQKKIITIHNGIDQNIFYPSKKDKSILKEFHLNENRPIIGFIGRLVYQKGLKYLFEACRIIENKNWQLLIVGDGPDKHQLITLSKQKKIEKKIVFCGERNDVANILSIIDIFVLPSLFEGFPLSILEAMALKKPIIATNINGIPEAIDHKKNGILVNPKDVDQLSLELDKLLSNPLERKRLANNAYETFIKKFTLKRMINKTEELYHSILS